MLRRVRTLGVYGVLIGHRRALFFSAAILSIASSMFEGLALVVLVPLISEASGDSFSGSNRFSDLVVDALRHFRVEPTLLSVIGIFALLGLVSSIFAFFTVVVSKKVMHDGEAFLRRELFREVFSMRWGVLGGSATGQLTKSFFQDAQNAGVGVYYLLLAVTAAASACIYFTLGFLLSPGMTGLTLVFGAVMAPVFVALTRRGRASARAASSAFEDLSSDALAAFGNAKFVVAQGLEPFFGSRVDVAAEGYRQQRLRNDTWVAAMRTIFELAAVAFVAGFLYLSLEVLDQSIAVALVFLVIFYRLLPRLLRAQETLFNADSHAVWLRQLLELRDHAIAHARPRAADRTPTFEQGLELQRVTVRHEGSDTPIFEDACLLVRRGTCVAVVGPSGQGKTSLLDLVTGLLEPERGDVLVDGVSLRDLDEDLWRDRIGFVLQDSPIFNASVRDNIVLDRAPLDQVLFDEACRMADVDEVVARLPAGYDTVVGEHGSQISGGQRQRIAIARALYRQPWLLLLDEPTSSLDADTERVIVEMLSGLKGQVTMLLVSHGTRLLGIADSVYRLAGGELALEVGVPSDQRGL